MRSGRSTWRPLFRTTERSWPSKTLPLRSSPPLLATQWVGQVRNEPHCTSLLLYVLSTPFHSVSPSHYRFITFPFSSPPYDFFSSFFCTSSFAFLFSPISIFPPPQHTCPCHHPPSFSPLFFRAYAHWWISNGHPQLFTLCNWLQTLCFSTSSSPSRATLSISCFKLHLSMQLLSYKYRRSC